MDNHNLLSSGVARRRRSYRDLGDNASTAPGAASSDSTKQNETQSTNQAGSNKDHSWVSSSEHPKHVKPEDFNRGKITTENQDPGKYFCKPCQEARQSPEYLARFASLFKPLYCDACRQDHPSFLFSMTQRRSYHPKLGKRVCIARDGHLRLCAHRTFSWADLMEKDWSKDPACKPAKFDGYTYEVRIECDHPDHRNVDNVIENGIGRPGLIIGQTKSGFKALVLGFLLKMKDTNHAVLEERYEHNAPTMISCLKSSFPSCPHAMTTPDRIYNMESHHRYTTAPDVRQYICSSPRCDASINFDAVQSSSGASWPVLFYNPFHLRGGKPLDLAWLSHLDPDSYGLFTDTDTKHIIWCDDRRCATTFELMRAHYLFDVDRDTTPFVMNKVGLTNKDILGAMDQYTAKLVDFAYDTSDQSKKDTMMRLLDGAWVTSLQRGKG